MNCPCCGQPLANRELSVSLDTNMVRVGNQFAKLTPLCAEILFVILGERPRSTTKEQLLRQVFASRETETSATSLQVAISRMRKKIRPLGIGIENTKPRNEGGRSLEGRYYLVTM